MAARAAMPATNCSRVFIRCVVVAKVKLRDAATGLNRSTISQLHEMSQVKGYTFDRIVIEMSGVAEPKNIRREFQEALRDNRNLSKFTLNQNPAGADLHVLDQTPSLSTANSPQCLRLWTRRIFLNYTARRTTWVRISRRSLAFSGS